MAEIEEPIKRGNYWTNIITASTGESVNFEEVDTWVDGSTMDDSKVDGVVYRKLPSSVGGGYVRRVFLDGVVNVKWFGAVCDLRATATATDNSVAIEQAISFMQAISAAGAESRKNTYTLLFPASGEGFGYGCSTDLDFGGGYNVQMDAPLYRLGDDLPTTGAFISVGRSDVIERIGDRNKNHKLWARVENIVWTGTGEYTGILVKNHVRTKINIVESRGFEIGVKFIGENGAFSYNQDIYIGEIINSRVGLDLDSTGPGISGYVTSCTFTCGRIGQDSNTNNAQYAYDRIGIRLDGHSYNCESLTFRSGVIEALLPSALPGVRGIPVHIINGQLNSFYDFRHEGNSPEFFKIEAGAPNVTNYASLTYTNHTYARTKDLVEGGDVSNIVVTRRGLTNSAQWGIGRTVFTTGHLPTKATPYNTGSSELYIEGLERTATNGVAIFQLQNATISDDGYLQLVGPFNNVTFRLDTSQLKRFIISPNWADLDKGKIYLYAYDEDGNVLPRTGNMSGVLNDSTAFGANGAVSYYSFYERPDEQWVWLSEEVKTLKIIIAVDTSEETGFQRLKLKSVDIISLQGDGATGTFVNRPVNKGYTSELPITGSYPKGTILYNDDFSTKPNSFGWINTAPGLNFAEIPLSTHTYSYKGEITTEDFNTLTDTGIYFKNGGQVAPNSPTSFAGVLEVTSNLDKSRIYQIWKTSTGSTSVVPHIYYRAYATGAGGWTPWGSVNNMAEPSIDTAAAVGVEYDQGEVQAILDELRDLKTKMRAAGLLAT